MPAQLTEKMRAFLNEVFPAIIALKRPNGSIQVTPIWFEYRDGHFWLNSVTSRRWPRHLQQNGEVEILLLDPKDMFRWLKVRGRLVESTTKGADEHIDRLSLRYTGNPRYQNRQPGEQRVTFKPGSSESNSHLGRGASDRGVVSCARSVMHRRMHSLACSSPPSAHLAAHPNLLRPIGGSGLRSSR